MLVVIAGQGAGGQTGSSSSSSRDVYLFKYTTARAGEWKPVDNTIEATLPDGTKEVIFRPVPALTTPEYLEETCNDFARCLAERRIEPLVAVAAFILDFLCVHPFLDGNGRLARLLTTLLLYRSGFTVARYVAVERLVEKTRPSYYASLRTSSEKWHEGQHSIEPWLDHLLGIIFAAYQELDQKVGGGDFPSKADRVRIAVELMPQLFSKAELVDACPNVSERTVKRVLEELTVEGRVEAARGKGALWRKK